MLNQETVFVHLNTILAEMPTSDLTKQDVRWLSWVFDLAHSSDYPKPNFRVGAAIVYRGALVGCGVNLFRSHPFQAQINRRSIYLHAEIVALLAAQKTDFDPEKSVIYVARSRKGKPGCSYPCEFCWGALSHVGIRTVICYDRSGLPQRICT